VSNHRDSVLAKATRPARKQIFAVERALDHSEPLSSVPSTRPTLWVLRHKLNKQGIVGVRPTTHLAAMETTLDTD
jgi:hypothetical protein